jgi:hypothetical protein
LNVERKKTNANKFFDLWKFKAPGRKTPHQLCRHLGARQADIAPGQRAMEPFQMIKIVTPALGLTRLIAARSRMKQPFSGLFSRFWVTMGNKETQHFLASPGLSIPALKSPQSLCLSGFTGENRAPKNGARYRVRTCDPYRVKVVLYH